MEEVRARKDNVSVQYQVVQEEESSDEQEDDDLCFQYDVDVLPPIRIDLDEIDDFLEHDIFVQELLEWAGNFIFENFVWPTNFETTCELNLNKLFSHIFRE